MNSPIAQNSSGSAVMYHYISNLLMLYKKTLLKGTEVDAFCVLFFPFEYLL